MLCNPEDCGTPTSRVTYRRARLKSFLLSLGIGLLASSVSCGGPSGAEVGPSDVTVELDAFSGRPNPEWTLSSAEAAELAALLRGLPALSDSTPPEAPLGYRGFWVRNPGGEQGIPERSYVSREGIVQVFDDDQRWRGFDGAEGVEAWLIELARERGFEVRR